MSFEHLSAEEQPSEQSAAAQIYEAKGLTGPSLGFSRSRCGTRQEMLAQNKDAQELYDEVASIIDTEQYPMIGSHPKDVIGAIGLVAEENQWKSYDDVNFDLIRKELEANGVPLRARKTREDVQ